MPDIQSAARAYLSAGFSVIPVKADKRPAVNSWREYQSVPMPPDKFPVAEGVAAICGQVSGNLECIDFDDPDTFQPFLDLLDLRYSGLKENLVYHQTPSGGYHVIYRRETSPPGNQIFAKDIKNKVRIESRGEGGYFLVPPSNGYIVLSGSLMACPILTDEQVEAVYSTAKVFDEKSAQPKEYGKVNSNSDAPGTVFNRDNDIKTLLTTYGWREEGKTTAGQGWVRPGKERGVSGVLLSSTGNFYCWTSSTPLEPGKSYTSFGLYAVYEYNSDYSAAAKSLIKKASESGKRSETVKEKEKPHKPSRSITVAKIMSTAYSPIQWAVPGIIPEGMTVLAGRPKFGKSWLMLGLSYAVSTGSMVWGFSQTKKASVHYLALEDSERRIQDRIRQMEGYFDEYPNNLYIYTDFPRIGEGFIEELTAILERDKEAGLIIIDTLQKVRPMTGGKRAGANLYQTEYEDYEKIQKWSIQSGIPVICIHHTRKGDPSKASNPFDEMSGSTGIQGVADTLIVCDKERGSNEGIMSVTGREVCEEDYPMFFHRDTMTWEIKTPEKSVDSGPFILSTWFNNNDSITVKEAAELWAINQLTARRKLDKLVEQGEFTKNKDNTKKNLIRYYPENVFFGKKNPI